MTTTEIPAGAVSEVDHARQLRRAVIASTVGTVIEAYDFLLYVQVAPLVFAKLYFPPADATALHCLVSPIGRFTGLFDLHRLPGSKTPPYQSVPSLV